MIRLRNIVACLALLCCWTSCEKDTEPVRFDVRMLYAEPTEQGRTSIRLNASVSSLDQISQVGFLYWMESEEENPGQVVIDKPASTSLSILLDSLRGGTTYYYKMYITNGMSRLSGEVDTFRTKSYSAPSLSGLTFVDEARTLVRAVIQDDGVDGNGADVIAKGFCWNLSGDASVSDQMVEMEGDSLAFVYDLSAIEADTFYIRAFARNNQVEEYAYGPELKVEREVVPWIVGEVSLLDETERKVSAFIRQEGDAAFLRKGFCWNATGEPVVEHDSYQWIEGDFEYALPELEEGVYYVRAFVDTEDGVVYGPELRFEREVVAWELGEVIVLDQEQGIVKGSILREGTFPLRTQGFCWSATGIPVVENDTYKYTGDDFECQLPYVSAERLYVRAFIMTEEGTYYYSETKEFVYEGEY